MKPNETFGNRIIIIKLIQKSTSQREVLFLHDADLNPRKKETPQSRRLCGEEEQPRSGRLFRPAEQAKRAARCDESPIIRTKKAPEGLLFYLQNPDILINRRSAHSKDSCRFADVELFLQAG